MFSCWCLGSWVCSDYMRRWYFLSFGVGVLFLVFCFLSVFLESEMAVLPVLSICSRWCVHGKFLLVLEPGMQQWVGKGRLRGDDLWGPQEKEGGLQLVMQPEGWGWGFGSRGREEERGGVWEFKIHWFKKTSRPFSFCPSHWILSGDMYANLLTPDPAIFNASVKLIQGNIISGVTACDSKIPVVFTLIACTVLMTHLTFPCISIFYLQHRTDCEQLDFK